MKQKIKVSIALQFIVYGSCGTLPARVEICRTRVMLIGSRLSYPALFSSCVVAMRHNLWIGRSYSPDGDWILALRIRPSLPGYTSFTRAILHFLLGVASVSKTRSPICKLSRGLYHLFLGRRFCAKYRCQAVQNSFTPCWMLLVRLRGFTLSTGGEMCGPSIRSFGVIGGHSQMLSELGYKGRLLTR